MFSTHHALCLAIAFCLAAGAFAEVSAPVNPTDRADVVRFYHEAYVGTTDYDSNHGWTGDVATCDPGTLSQALHDDVIDAVNYFRAMAGLPAEITLSAELNAKCQEAALMMAYNNTLNHNPPSSWPCYSADGAEAAVMSNLSLGTNIPHYGPDAILGQMEDEGAGNKPVGHRRWILHTKAPDQMGHGSIPLTPTIDDPATQNSAMALWVVGDSTSTLPDDFEFVAWPPKGCVPYQFAFKRWSFGLPKGGGFSPNFDTATVTITHDGSTVPATIVHRTTGAGDPSIVFEPEGFPLDNAPSADLTYSVTIDGIRGAPKERYSYIVEVIDPERLTPIELDGPETAYAGFASNYTFPPSPVAQSYQVRIASTTDGDWVEGAESPDYITASAPHTHPLRVTTFAQTGSRSFQLLDADRSFEIDRAVIPSATSELHFDQRFRWVGNGTALTAEIRGDSGSWEEIWRRQGYLFGSGNSSQWDSAWTNVSVSLAAYAGQTVSIRFRYPHDPNGYNWFPNGSPGDSASFYGAFVDGISVSDSQQFGSESVINLPASADGAQFVPPTPGDYSLQIRAEVADQWFAFGPTTTVQVIDGSPPVQSLKLVGAGLGPAGTYFLEAINSGFATVWVQSSTDGGETWANDDSFQQSSSSSLTQRFTGSAGSGSRLFRLAAE